MRKSFLTKAFVAVGVMASAMVLSSMAVFAATPTVADLETGVQYWPTSGKMSTNTAITSNLTIGTTYKLKTSDKDVYSNGVDANTTNLSSNGVFSTTCQINSNGFNLKGGNSATGTNVAQFKTPTNAPCTLSITETAGKMFYMCYGSTVVEIAGSSETITGQIPSNTLITLVGSSKGTAKVSQIVVNSVNTEPDATLDSTATVTENDTVDLEVSISNIQNPTYQWEIVGTDNHLEITAGESTQKATIKGLSVGTQTVKVTVNGTNGGNAITPIEKTCDVTVNAPLSVDTVTIAGESAVNLGYATTLTATIDPVGATNGDVTWSVTSGADKVQLNTVTGNTVKVKGLSAGTAEITATAGGKSDAITITVSAPTATVISANGTFNIGLAAKTAGFAVDKETILTGTVLADSFTVTNTYDGTDTTKEANYVCLRTSNSCVQTAQNELGYISFTTNKAFDVTIPFASTGSANVSKIELLDANNTVISENTVKGTTSANLVINNLPAGTYKIASPVATSSDAWYGRGARLTTVTFADPTEVSIKDTAENISKQTFTKPDGLNVNALYAYDKNTGYVIFEFENNTTLQAANSIGYEDLTIDSLYTSITFDDGSSYSKPGYLVIGFVTDKMNTTEIKGTFTVAE